MSDECKLPPGVECPNVTKIALLENRVEGLEKGQVKSEEFRALYHEEKEERIKRDALLESKVDRMDRKLDALPSDIEGRLNKLTAWKEEEQNKPNKLLDGIKDKLVGAVIGAVGVGIVAAIIFLIKTLA